MTISTSTIRTNRTTARATLASAALAALLLSGCSGSGNDSGADSSSAGGEAEVMSDSADLGAGPAAQVPRASGRGAADSATNAAAGALDAEREVSTGSVSLVSDDVADTRFDVQRIAIDQGGSIADDTTETDRGGEVVRSRMVLRVPVDVFEKSMSKLEAVADLRSSQQASEVVTDTYLDLEARVRAQEKSLERVELLFSRAEDIRDIMAIESQLGRRQADLDSLKGQLRLLDDRTSMSTITVHVERSPEAAPEEKDDRAGFLPGLESGWHALQAAFVGVATVVGALLPFLVVLAAIGVPLWLLLRSTRRRRPATTPGPAAE
jgi:hypothetical protein